MSREWIVTGFFTEDTPYEEQYKKYLLPSMLKFDLRFDIQNTPNKGSWLKNVAMKPLVILEAMKEHPHWDIVSIDVDAEFLHYPDLFDILGEKCDIAYHSLNWRTWYGHNVDKKELLSGTLFIKNTEYMREVVEQWGVMANNSTEWEQKCLERVLSERPQIKVYNLPLEYCFIKSRPNEEPPLVKVENPVIRHHQASRTLKKRINRGI